MRLIYTKTGALVAILGCLFACIACSEDPVIPWVIEEDIQVVEDVNSMMDTSGDVSIDISDPMDGGGSEDVPNIDGGGVLEPDQIEAARRARLRWKRLDAFANDLSVALDVPKAELCLELGVADCFGVHELSLGAASPFQRGIYEAAKVPQITTAAASDRIVLTACITRADRDASSDPVVFKTVDLAAAAVDVAALKVDAEELFRRFHARDATTQELSLIGTLAIDDDGTPVSGRNAAVLTCFAIGSTTEAFLF